MRRNLNPFQSRQSLNSAARLCCVAGVVFWAATSFGQSVVATKLDGKPGTPGMDPILDASTFTAIGAPGADNINGPSVIRVPDWIPVAERVNPDANYYMYFANHGGKDIRLAWAESITGQWHLFNTGSASGAAWGTGGNNGTQTPGDGVLDLRLDDYLSAPAPGNKQINIDGPGLNIYGIGDEIASPDVFVDDVNQRIVMYFHGDSWGSNRDQAAVDDAGRVLPGQHTYVTTSKYGLNFNHADQADPADTTGDGIREVLLSQFYARVFEVRVESNGQLIKQTFAYTNRGFLYKAPLLTTAGDNATMANADEPGGLWNPTSDVGAWWTLLSQNSNPLNGIKISPDLQAKTRDANNGDDFRTFGEFTNDETPRHFSIYQDYDNEPDTIYVFYSSRGDKPESIVLARLSLAGLTPQQRLDPANWALISDTEEMILTPEYNWEGADQPLAFSGNGAQTNVRQLRDPYLFVDDDGSLYLFYTGEGEEAIGVASLKFVTLTGDANNDGIVDAADMLAVDMHIGNVGANHGHLLGDANDDGRVDGSDYLAVEQNFGQTLAGMQINPEPASLNLLALGAVCLCKRRCGTSDSSIRRTALPLSCSAVHLLEFENTPHAK